MPKLFFKIRLCRVMLELSPAAFDIYSEMQEVDMVKVNTAAKRHKTHKKIIYILLNQIVMNAKNINSDFLRICQG